MYYKGYALMRDLENDGWVIVSVSHIRSLSPREGEEAFDLWDIDGVGGHPQEAFVRWVDSVT